MDNFTINFNIYTYLYFIIACITIASLALFSLGLYVTSLSYKQSVHRFNYEDEVVRRKYHFIIIILGATILLLLLILYLIIDYIQTINTFIG